MKPQDDLDKILLTEEPLNPSPAFLRDVMLRVQVEMSLKRTASVPRLLFAAAMFLMAIPIIWIFPAESLLNTMNLISYSIGQWILTPGDPALRSVFSALLSLLLGILILVWFSLRLAGAS